ncbi:MAG: lysylphosphatidylglycerol synthase transmembrane domain-containing protein [Planctomycetota bacterium]
MGRRVLLGVLFGVVVYAGIVLWIDLDDFQAALRDFPPHMVVAACGLSFANYLIRFVKWERYLKLLSIALPRGTSFLIYLAGFSMGVTPGKMGEVFKSWMIRRVTGTPIHKSAPIVIAERVTDLLGYLILMAVGGIATVPEYQWVFWGTLALCAVGLALAGSHTFSLLVSRAVSRTPFFWRFARKVEGSFESTRVLLSPREIVLPTLLSVVSWGCECTAFWLIIDALSEAPFPYLYAVFAYAFSAVAGAVAIVFPGGLVITEGTLGTLTRRKLGEVGGLSLESARSIAAGATLIVRLCTLWFGVLVGVIATMLFQRRYGEIEMGDGDEGGDA